MYRYRAEYGILLVLILLPFLFFQQQQQSLQKNQPKPYQVAVKFAFRNPDEVANWTLAHIKHAWVVGKAVDSEDNVTLLLEKVEERGYAVSYCYGIVSVWAYLLYSNNISKPYILVVKEPDGLYHAVGMTFYNDSIYTFYANGKAEVVMIQDPYPEMRGFPLDKFVKELGFLPAKYGYSSFKMEEVAEMARENRDTVWYGPLYVKSDGYALLEYRNIKQTLGSQPLEVVVKNGYLAKPSENVYAFNQVIGVKFTDFAIVYAGDWVTILVNKKY